MIVQIIHKIKVWMMNLQNEVVKSRSCPLCYTVLVSMPVSVVENMAGVKLNDII